jgi:hypothetical protein
MTASPPLLQIHLLLNVLNRFAFTPGLGEREQSGIECLGDYLVAAHRLQTAAPVSAQASLQATLETLLALNQWLREDAAPTVAVRCRSLDDERLSRALAPLASRLQAALMLLDGRPIRGVEVELSGVECEALPAIAAVIAVTPGAQAPGGSPSAPPARDGLHWVDADAASPGTSMSLRFEMPG